MGFARQITPAMRELTGSWNSAAPCAELPGRASGGDTARMSVAPATAPRDRPAAAGMPDLQALPRISLVVVGGGGVEAFPLADLTLDAFNRKIAGAPGGWTPRVANGARDAVDAELSGAESRVLRHLPTRLTAREIADELWVSVNTVKTHMRHIYAKLDAHTRREAVERARTLGLLATRKHSDVAQHTRTPLAGSIPQGANLGGM